MRPNGATAGIDWAVAELAERRYGILTVPELLGCRPSQRGISRRVAAKRLYRLHRLLPRNQFEAAVRRGEKLHLDTGGLLDPEPDRDFNALERRFLALCRRHSPPRPRTQQVIGPLHRRLPLAQHHLIVEADGFGDHGTRSGFESDRARDAWLTAHGYRVVRFTWRQLRDEPGTVVSVLRQLLARL